MSTEKTLTPEESLEIARSMIGISRKTFMRQSFYFLLWGWLLIMAGIGEFILYQLEFELFWIVWPIVGMTGAVIAGVHGAREGKRAPASTVTDLSISAIWIGYTISLFLFITAMVMNEIPPNAFIIIMTGMPTFASGMVLKFKPLIIGGILFWIIGFASLFIPFEFTSLSFSLAILLGYVVPGHLLNKAEKNGSL